MRRVKLADDSSPQAPSSAVSPIPQVQITPQFAPGKKGPAGTAPRTNYSRVNTGVPMASDAGAQAQKSMSPRGAETLPKVAGSLEDENPMGQMTQRPRLQDMVKAAMADSVGRIDVGREAARQAHNMGEKVAAVAPPVADTGVSYEFALKLASAIEYIAQDLQKGAAVHVGEGPNALHVTESSHNEPNPIKPGNQGHAHHAPPLRPGMGKGLPGEHEATQLENDLHHTPGGSQHQKTATVAMIRKLAVARDDPKKTASVVSQIRESVKLAEDAINPAHISAGSAVPPETSASGESGGNPVGGPPRGNTSLIQSNEAATNFTRGQAYAGRRQEMKNYIDEPMQSSATDKTLQLAFEHTGQAGTKFASELSTKTAAAKALLAKIAEETLSTKAAQAAGGRA